MFRGKLVCLCCDLGQDPGKASKCDENGHHEALMVHDDAMLHPLIASEAITAQINSGALHGKEVVVTGKYYPAISLIFVQSVRPATD